MSELIIHIEPVTEILRIYIPGKCYENKDAYIASAVVVWINPVTVELRGMIVSSKTGHPNVSIVSARMVIAKALIDRGVCICQFERYRNGSRKMVVIDLVNNKFLR